MTHILIADDDSELQALLRELLELEGFTISQAFDGQAALKTCEQVQPDLLLLDVMMPQLNGFEVLKQLRMKNALPVLMLTAKGDELDRVLGLELGADDYLPKPFSDRELLARIRAILRRAQSNVTNEDKSLNQGDININENTQQVHCQNQEITLTATEYLLLNILVKKTGELVSKDELNKLVLGRHIQAFDRSLDMHLSNLRRKLPQRIDGLERIKTLRGRGYIWLGETHVS